VSRSADGGRWTTRARPRPRRVLLLLAPLALAACGTAETPPGAPGDSPSPLTMDVPAEPAPVVTDPAQTAPPQFIDDLGDLPGMPEHAPRTVDDDDAAQDLTVAFQNDPRFGTVALDGAGGYVVHWHGDPPPELTAMIERHPDVAIRVEQTAYLPGRMRDLAHTVVTGVDGVSFAAPAPDYSGLTVGVAPGAHEDPEVLADELSERYGVPVAVDVASVAPAPMVTSAPGGADGG